MRSEATTVEEYLSELPAERREALGGARRVAAEVAIDQSPGTLTLHQQEPGEGPAFRRARRLRARA